MRIAKLLLICMCGLLAQAVWGQTANGTGIRGYYDPQTRTFHPLPKAAQEAPEPLTLTNFIGTVKVAFTITLKTAGLTNIDCVVIVSVSDSTVPNQRRVGELGIVPATGTGATRTCTVSVPYSWELATQPTDKMVTSYEITDNVLGKVPIPDRTSFLTPLDSRAVPASGATTSLTANVTQ